MSSSAEFKSLMTDLINLRKRKRSVGGDFSNLTTTQDLPAFVEYGNKLVTNKKGEEITATAIVFLQDDCGIDINWEYWMIDQTSPYIRSNMEVINIDPIDDPRTGDTHHFEIAVR